VANESNGLASHCCSFGGHLLLRGLGYILGRAAMTRPYKSLNGLWEVLQKIQQDYVDDPTMHT